MVYKTFHVVERGQVAHLHEDTTGACAPQQWKSRGGGTDGTQKGKDSAVQGVALPVLHSPKVQYSSLV